MTTTPTSTATPTVTVPDQRPARLAPDPAPAGARVAVVMPVPNDPDWSLFDSIPDEVPILVCDDSDGRLAPPPRDNVTYYDWAAQREIMGAHWDAIPHKSAAARNFGHYLAYRDGYDVTVALDYDCRPRQGWLAEHLAALGPVVQAPALQAAWVNTMTAPGVYARGFPYESRNAVDGVAAPALATGEVKLNMGVWDHILDMNGVDKLQKEPPYDPGVHPVNPVALGRMPLCGMNTAFATELTPAFFFLPDVWVDGWQLSRHDDIWGGYVLEVLLELTGDLVRFGGPVVEHTRQTPLERVVVMEHWMHLMAREFYAAVDAAATRVAPGSYAKMFCDLTEELLVEVTRSSAPRHYRQVYRELAESMQRWARCFA